MKLVFVANVTIIPAVPLGFGNVSMESVKRGWGVEAVPDIVVKAESIKCSFC